MPASKPKDPQSAYAVKRALVEMRLGELRKALQAHEAQRPILWTHVNDLAFAEEELAVLVEALALRQQGS